MTPLSIPLTQLMNALCDRYEWPRLTPSEDGSYSMMLDDSNLNIGCENKTITMQIESFQIAQGKQPKDRQLEKILTLSAGFKVPESIGLTINEKSSMLIVYSDLDMAAASLNEFEERIVLLSNISALLKSQSTELQAVHEEPIAHHFLRL